MLDELCERLGVEVREGLLTRALTHRSYAYENGGIPTNERLEFLGDSVLGLVVTETLFVRHPDKSEGELAKMRASVVNAMTCADIARELGLGRFLLLGRGEETTGGRDKSSILADTLEAVIGAVHLDQGLLAADALIHRLFDPHIDRAAELGAGLDWKTSLQELTASLGLGVPEYLVEQSGPDHSRSFSARVKVGDSVYGNGRGPSKKQAEQQAASTAWQEIKAACAPPATHSAGPNA